MNDDMWKFFQSIGVIDAFGKPTASFGQPLHLWKLFKRALGDTRSDQELIEEGKKRLGVFSFFFF